MTKTQLKKITIEKFRALKNVDIDFGDYVTVICGKNGTSKSSILGIAAQIFSFENDRSVIGSALSLVTGKVSYNIKAVQTLRKLYSNKLF